ncbi:hypothetical protein LJC20_01160 [Eubacteriales bacterium OttesenSCG-928-M02]|nr:hypothetical protein [Eubacteriales bacterium OttesenSCG-928-M02]
MDFLSKPLQKNGYLLRLLPLHGLDVLRHELHQLQADARLSSYQASLEKSLSRLSLPKVAFPIRSILFIGIPHPAYAKLSFFHHGENRLVLSPLIPDYSAADATVAQCFAATSYHHAPAKSLPLKALAVHSGMAVYGKNNLTFTKEYGSFLSYTAYVSDVPPGEDIWYPPTLSPVCTTCAKCAVACPTGAIRPDVFLVDAATCLSNQNELPGLMSPSIPAHAHHAAYDCMLCQLNCPLNNRLLSSAIGPIHFSQAETTALLRYQDGDVLPPETISKLSSLQLLDWLPVLPRNLTLALARYANA